jgi:YHS domain-containing protein
MNATKSPLTVSALVVSSALLVTAALGFVGCSSSGHDHSSHSHGTAAAKPYPLTKCLVTDEGFNHGKPYTFVHQGQEIKLCCEDCLADFKKEPSKYLSKLAAPK